MKIGKKIVGRETGSWAGILCVTLNEAGFIQIEAFECDDGSGDRYCSGWGRGLKQLMQLKPHWGRNTDG